MSDSISISERLSQLQNMFHQGLPGRMEELEQLWSALDKGWDTKNLNQFLHKVHSLAGTAGTFGASTIGHAARKIEVALKQFDDAEVAPDEAGKRLLARDFDRLLELARGWDPSSAPHLPPEDEATKFQRGNNLVYIVEDDELVGKTLVEELAAVDYDTHWFRTPEEFKKACEQWVPEVVVMDMVFDGTDITGAEVISSLLQELDPRPHVVFISVRDDIQARLAAVRVGAKRYFTKPVNMREFIHTLDSLTEKTVSDPYRILLVDDDKAVSQYYALVLEEQGMRTQIISDPMQCLEAIAAFKPDMVLMDLYMPGCTGVELAAIIRQDDTFAQMPITFLSSEAQLDKQLAAMHLGGDDFLTKPVKPEHLVDACLARVKRARQVTRLTRRLQHALRESEYRQLALNQHSIVSTTDASGTITSVNRKFCDTSKYKENELVGKTHSLVNSGYHPPEFFEDMWQTISDGRVWHGVIRNRNKEGGFYWVDSTIVPFLDNNGLPYQYVSVRTDITELVLSRDEILVAKKEADQANAAKSVFLSSMSHELRTPMNAILGFGQLLESSDIDEHHKNDVREILRAGTHQLNLINEILDLSKIESGRIDISIEPIMISTVVQTCRSLMAPLIEKRELSFEIQSGCDTDLCVAADPTRLTQIVLNLFSNAVKYNREKGSIMVRYEEVDTHRVRLEVRDTGIGIPPEDQDEIFKPFFRVGRSSAETEGTGIGLSISKRLVDNMGGAIGFESVPNQGTTFWVELEKADMVESRSADGKEKDLSLKEVKSRNSEEPRILYIEDNVANIKLVEKIIDRRADVGLVSVQQPGTGIRMAKTISPVIVLVDVNMPEMDGFEVLRRLRENPQTASIPVIAVSANVMAEDMSKAAEAGFDGYITKPIDINTFNQTIDKALQK